MLNSKPGFFLVRVLLWVLPRPDLEHSRSAYRAWEDHTSWSGWPGEGLREEGGREPAYHLVTVPFGTKCMGALIVTM